MHISKYLPIFTLISLASCTLVNDHLDTFEESQDIANGFGSALITGISKKIEWLLNRMGALSNNEEDVVWIEFYDDADPIGNYTLNTTFYEEEIGNYTVHTNASVLVIKSSNGSTFAILTEEIESADAEDDCCNDEDCDDDQFCSIGLFYGSECSNCQEINEVCSRHSQCCNDTVCYFGRCKAGVRRGDFGATCIDVDDCGEDACCAAMEHSLVMVTICKPLARVSESCDTGLQSWLATVIDMPPATVCPCAGGLKCKDMGFILSNDVCTKEARRESENESNLGMDRDTLRFNPIK